MAPALLVVEDDDTLRETLHDALTLEGFQVTACGNGRDALRKLLRCRELEGDEPFSLVVLDLMLPGLGGLDLCRQMRQSGDRTPIIVVSSRESETDRVLGLEVGAA
ncbi:MAG: response regulator, partial [bacterium]